MISTQTIEEVKNRLVQTYTPLEIYLFGSYAWGTPHEDSDLDVLIIVEQSKERAHKRSIAGSKSLRGLMISRDIIVYTKDEFDQKSHDVSTLCYKIKHEGKRLYAKAAQA